MFKIMSKQHIFTPITGNHNKDSLVLLKQDSRQLKTKQKKDKGDKSRDIVKMIFYFSQWF